MNIYTDLVNQTHRKLGWAATDYYQSLDTLTLWQSELERLPEGGCGWADKVSIIISYVGDAEDTRSACQKVLGGVAKRTVDKYSGQVVYEFETERITAQRNRSTLEVRIYGGQLAPGCVPKEVVETRKVYEVSCDEV